MGAKQVKTNSKSFKTLDEQIIHLEKNKKIIFEDKNEAKKILLNNNYINLISAIKYAFFSEFAYDESDGKVKHVYNPSYFSQWTESYNEEKRMAKIILSSACEKERILNSRLAYFLSEMVNKNVLNEMEKEDLKACINLSSIISKKKLDYNFEETWRYVQILSFGDILRVIKLIDDFKRTRENKFREKMSKTDEGKQIRSYLQKIIVPTYEIEYWRSIKNLRDVLAHNTPISIYLTTNLTENEYMKRAKTLRILAENNVELTKFVDKLSKTSRIYIQKKGGKIK
ncbi:MAG: hypothetical protein ACRC6X_03630 [Culicoidibacterales bacterium]